MTDERWIQLGESLVHKSLQIKPGEKLMIAMYEVESYPLALAVYGACIRAGGFPQVQFMSEALKHKVLKYGNNEQISWIPEIEAYGMDWADCYIALRGAFNLNECYDIPVEKIAKYQKAMGTISAMRWQKTRWTLVRVPNERFAQQAHVSHDKIMNMFFDACNKMNYEADKKKYAKVIERLNAGHSMHILGRGTDLTIGFSGNKWMLEEPLCNIPTGEIAVTPKWETVTGQISFEFPATLGGKVIHNLCIKFKDGRAYEVAADDNVDYVNQILDSDEGSRRVGEFAFGINPYVDVCTTDILIDEKMGGTMHIAMGRPYNGSYYSSIHWDIVKDVRTEAKMFLDKEPFFESGKFVDL